jgi:hypothetical protein
MVVGQLVVTATEGLTISDNYREINGTAKLFNNTASFLCHRWKVALRQNCNDDILF